MLLLNLIATVHIALRQGTICYKSEHIDKSCVVKYDRDLWYKLCVHNLNLKIIILHSRISINYCPKFTHYLIYFTCSSVMVQCQLMIKIQYLNSAIFLTHQFCIQCNNTMKEVMYRQEGYCGVTWNTRKRSMTSRQTHLQRIKESVDRLISAHE